MEKKKNIVKINESQLMDIVKESVKNILKENAMNECGEMEEGLDEGFFNNLKTGTKTFFQKSGKGLKDRFSDAKKNFATQGEYDELSDLTAKLSDLLDKRKINPNMTVGQLVGGKYNNNKFGTLSGMINNRKTQMNHRMS